MPKVAVIILTYNSQADILPCLTTVSRQSYEGEYELVVVDNNSTDRTIPLVQENFPQVKIIRSNANRGYAGGNNIGLRYGLENKFDYLILLNPDMEVDIDWLKQLVKVASEKEDGGLIQSKIIFSQERYRINSVGNPLHYLGFSWSGGYKELSSRFQKVKKIAVASGASILIKAEVLRTVGLLDDRFFMYHEDLDLSWRAELAGFNIYLSPDSKAYHKYSFSFGTKKFYYFERNRWLVFFSNYRLGTILLLLPAFILTDLAMLIYALFTGWFRFKISSYFGFFLLIPHLLKRSIDNSKIRQRTDREILNLMVSELDFDDVNNFFIKRLYNPFAKVYFKVIKSLITW